MQSKDLLALTLTIRSSNYNNRILKNRILRISQEEAPKQITTITVTFSSPRIIEEVKYLLNSRRTVINDRIMIVMMRMIVFRKALISKTQKKGNFSKFH